MGQEEDSPRVIAYRVFARCLAHIGIGGPSAGDLRSLIRYIGHDAPPALKGRLLKEAADEIHARPAAQWPDQPVAAAIKNASNRLAAAMADLQRNRPARASPPRAASSPPRVPADPEFDALLAAEMARTKGAPSDA